MTDTSSQDLAADRAALGWQKQERRFLRTVCADGHWRQCEFRWRQVRSPQSQSLHLTWKFSFWSLTEGKYWGPQGCTEDLSASVATSKKKTSFNLADNKDLWVYINIFIRSYLKCKRTYKRQVVLGLWKHLPEFCECPEKVPARWLIHML